MFFVSFTIIARNLDIPAVVGLGQFLAQVQDGDTVILDGSQGILIINTDDKTLRGYRRREGTYRAYKDELQSLHDLPAETRDGKRIQLLANIDHPDDVNGVLAHGAAREIAKKALSFATSGEVRKYLEGEMRSRRLYF